LTIGGGVLPLRGVVGDERRIVNSKNAVRIAIPYSYRTAGARSSSGLLLSNRSLSFPSIPPERGATAD